MRRRRVQFDQLNVQDQPRFVWPATFVLARAYLDQLARDNGLSANRRTAVAHDLATAQQHSGAERQSTLTHLATQLAGDAGQLGTRRG